MPRRGISTISAMNLISVAAELKHRLPGLWALSEGLEVAAWKLKMTARFHPEQVTEAEQAGKAAWDVRIQHPGVGDWAGTSWLDGCADSADLTKFGDLVADLARRLGEAGDPDTLEQRRAKAIGIVADVHAGADLDDLIAALVALVTPATGQQPVRRPRIRCRDLQLYIYLPAEDLAGSGEGGLATVEGLGVASLERIEAWLDRHTAAGARARVTPVIDLAQQDAVDRHDPPPWMAERVKLRDRQCVFPYCQTNARDCDLDHIIPYVPPDEGGPPGQTNPRNLAPLCRRHHRAKTATRWRYQRTDDGSYAWTSRYEERYLVTNGGTIPLADH